ncbi:MAG TPA: caspase family protein, partial [Haliangium sp.]|nr:caspase family protein [Haliangium sp.]
MIDRAVRFPRRRPARALGLGLALALGAALLWPAPARAQIERFALVIGNNFGGAGDVPLRYAEDDASKIYGVLENLGGFRPENMQLLRGRSAEEVRDALIAINERIRRQAGPGRSDTMLFVYYSGHADARALHLGASDLALRQLEQLVTGSAAEFRVLVLDACRSGALTRVKGGRRAPPLSISLEDQLAGEGTVFLTASSANEDAQESDQVKGSFFTHYLVSGLIGAADQNQDGRVVLEEAYRYAYEHTLRASSRTLAGTQHPTFKYDMRGQGQVVLTRVMSGQHRALVHLPAGRSYLLLRDGPEGPVVAEVGARDQVRRISVAAGRYFVRGRASSYLLEGIVHLSGGAERTIGDELLDRIEYARFVRKGAAELRAVHGPQAGLRGRSAL